MNPTPQDFRGYLNQLGSQGDKAANAWLGFVGGDYAGGAGGVNQAKLAAAVNPLRQQGINLGANPLVNYYQQYQSVKAGGAKPPGSMPSIYGGGGSGFVAPPRLDIAGTYAQARSAAEGAVNPYYSKLLSDFLTQQGAIKQRRQTEYDTSLKNIEDSLAETVESNQIAGKRTGEDVAENIGQINVAEDQFQTDSGDQFEDDRIALARQQAAGGRLGSAAGARETQRVVAQRNTSELRKTEEFQTNKKAQELFKGRTLEDLERSSGLAGKAAEKGKKAAKFDLDAFLQDSAFEEQNQRNRLEQERLERVSAETQSQAKLKFNQYLANIKNPAQLSAAASTYGVAF